MKANPKITEQRQGLVEKARQVWIRRLIDLSRRNNLLFYRPLKTGTLTLSLADRDRMVGLLQGEIVNITSLVEDPRDQGLPTKLRDIWRRAQTNAEEKGLATLFVALGMATWKAADGGRDPEAPILLLPVALEARGRIGNLSSLRRTGVVQVNLVLLHVLETEFGIKLTPDDLLPLLQGDDEGEAFDPTPVYNHLADKCRRVAEFRVKEATVLGNFAFQKMAMVNELKERGSELATHDIVAALAGDTEAKKQVAESHVNPDPRELDTIPPSNEFLILDADSSQQRAIASVLADENAVIHGPPGTGKSQTIANLIASLTSTGRRILFVAEKRAALEVVLKRLKHVGLQHIAIDLHGADVSSRQVTEQIAAALDAVRHSPPVDCEAMHKRFVERRERLNRHVERLHHKREPAGLSVYELQGHLLRLQSEAHSDTRWRGSELARIKAGGVDRVRELLKEAVGFATLFRRTDPSPWTGAKLRDGMAVERALDLVARLSQKTWPAFTASIEAVTQTTRFKPPRTLKEAKQIFTLLAAVRHTLSLYMRELYGRDLQALLRDFSPGSTGGWAAFWAWLANSSFRAARKAVIQIRKDGKTSTQELFAEVSAAEEQRLKWRELSGGASLPHDVIDYLRHRQAFDSAVSEITELQTFASKKGIDELPLDEVGSYIDALYADSLTPRRLPKLFEIETALEKAGVEKLVAEIRTKDLIPEKWIQAFDFVWFSSCMDSVFAEDPDIAGFNGRTHDEFVREFRELDQERISIAAARVRRAYAEKAVATMNQHPEQEYIVRAEAQKKRRHLPLRKLFAQAQEVLTAVCPCWMASPLSVSQLLDTKACFDVVIFDEASQVLPEDAVPAILRGSRLVVAGDHKQLPPTTFFAAGDDDELFEEENASAAEGFESLLDITNSFMPSRYLDWHYRSREESLISFSNHHIYTGRLVTFPGPGGPPVVKHVLVNQPLGQDGQEESCAGEVRKVVELVLDHVQKLPNESLGVIAMGIRHAKRVEAALDEALENRPDLDAFFDQSKEEHFFVKNLERVQGDERDAIILTVGYGKDRGGNLPFRFGPLLSVGGQRRLNVAVTRARNRMTLVSSFSHTDMDLSKVKPGTGVELLRYYLQYAATNGKQLADAQATGVPLNAFEAEIFDVLQSKGMPLIPQVGASRFRIDLVAQHPREPGRFVLAIECDGASYHSSATARDRDRLRQQQLENLGWKFHRIWSTDWFMRKDEELERALAAYRAAVDEADHPRGNPHNPGPAPIHIPPPGGNANSSAGLRRGPRPSIPYRDSIGQYSDGELTTLVRWLNSDGHLRTDDELVSEMVRELGFTRRGTRIEASVREAIELLRSRNML
ncbi:MAG: DUF4011 domain-containing protein [Acidobacteria bacterium]|nr:DUF4011 domain-containing protein [Acidobacteriota bacterium]